jgi:hypothetical protein
MSRPEPGKVNLPKKDMVASITKVIQERRIKVVKGCENAGLFRSELKAFQLKVSASGNNSYNAAPGSHDDTITAVGLCLWYGEKGGGGYRGQQFVNPLIRTGRPPDLHRAIPTWMTKKKRPYPTPFPTGDDFM